jgi:hypothetical protein
MNRRCNTSLAYNRVFRSTGAAKTAGVQREEAETRTGICVLIFIGNSSLEFGRVDEDFQ